MLRKKSLFMPHDRMIFSVKLYFSCRLLPTAKPSLLAQSMPRSEWQAFSRRVGAGLAQHRRSRGLSQQQVGEAIGVEPETISRMETGVISPSLKRLYQLASLFDCSLEALLGGASDQPHDLLRQLSAPLAILTDQERAFVIHQSLSLAAWLAARSSHQGIPGLSTHRNPHQPSDALRWGHGKARALRLQEGNPQPSDVIRDDHPLKDKGPSF